VDTRTVVLGWLTRCGRCVKGDSLSLEKRGKPSCGFRHGFKHGHGFLLGRVDTSALVEAKRSS
jgi:hypothetical protein